MRLSKIHATEFRSIRDTGEFDVGDTTCLVGKNEAGKTAVLEAVYRLNPIVAGDAGYDVTDDYPRMDVEDYEHDVETEERSPAVVALLTFELEPKDIARIEAQVGSKALTDQSFTVSRAYGQENITFNLQLNAREALRHLVGQHSFTPDLAEKFNACDSPALLHAALAETEQTEDVQALIARVDPILAKKSVVKFVFETLIWPHLPKFLYFDEYYQMRGCDNIEALKARETAGTLEPPDLPLLGLVNLARLDLDQLLNPERTRQLKNKLEGAGNHLTKKVVQYWSQNRYLQMRFDVRPARPNDPEGMTAGTNLWAEVYDTKHMVTTELGTRSRGFVWFFSFLAWYGDVLRKNENVILLLDEPGMSLHAKAQEDLLRYFDAEVKHQLIYTTHSPFMVDAGKFERVRIVQDLSIESDDEVAPEKQGTKVLTDVLDATEESLFPLQGALGYEIHQALFVGPNCLVVEGPSELLYFPAISSILEGKGRKGLSSKWTITPVGGADKVPTFVALIGAQKRLNLAVLVDYQKKDKQSIENLYKRKLMQKKKVLTFADFATGDEADIEDMFEPDFYLRLVNEAYANDLAAGVIKLSDLNNDLPRMTQRLDAYFKEHPLKGKVTFNHYRPARHLLDNLKKLEKAISADTLDRFESAFNSANALL